MRYLSYYREYPIYEPAEGGYYAGNQLVKSERLSKRQCRRKFEKTWQECQEENKKNGFAENADWLAVGRTYGIHPWIRWGDNYICRESGYVGQGESYVIERRKGSQTKGWQPYC